MTKTKEQKEAEAAEQEKRREQANETQAAAQRREQAERDEAQAAAQREAEQAERKAAEQKEAEQKEAEQREAEAAAKAAELKRREQAEREQAAREREAHNALRVETTTMPSTMAALEASQQRANEVDERNREAQEEAAAKSMRMQAEEQDRIARRDAIISQGLGVGGPDPEGKAEGAANYDKPAIGPERGSAEWHLKFPGELTSGLVSRDDALALENSEELRKQREAEDKNAA